VAVKPIPDGYHTVTPYLVVEDCAKLIEFLKEAFDGKEQECMKRPDGRVLHAEVRIGDSVVMMGEAQGQFKPMPGSLYLYVKDTDATYKRALGAGGMTMMEPADQFYGDRNAGVMDPCGNLWWIATRQEDLSREEITKRAAALMK